MTNPSEPQPVTEKVPPIVRTVAYWLIFTISIIGLLGVGLSPIWWPDLSDKVGQTWVVISNAFGFIAGALGVIYRPTGKG